MCSRVSMLQIGIIFVNTVTKFITFFLTVITLLVYTININKSRYYIFIIYIYISYCIFIWPVTLCNFILFIF